MFDEDDIRLVLQRVREYAGLVFEPEKRYLVESRLRRLAQPRGMKIAELMALLRERNPQACAEVAEAMAIQETYFFRDPWLFESLTEEVLPLLIERRATQRRLRIWCAACATGQEVYSLALLLEQFPQLADWDVQILGSDFSPQALARARAGRYSHLEVNRGLPARQLAFYFQRAGLEWEVGRMLRRRVRFEAINLVEDWPELPTFDIVLLRNVLIYFDAEVKRDVLQRIRGVMPDDGFLFLGGSESPLGFTDAFLPSVTHRACYYRLQKEPQS